MPSPAAERIAWAVATLGLDPRDRVLEVGCGHGVAVTLICAALGGGHVVALDRSATMTEAAARRNAACAAAGRVSFVTAALAEADLGDRVFDKVLAIHVGAFLRRDPGPELEKLAAHLAPGGRLHLAWQPLEPDRAKATGGALAAGLRRHGWTVERTLAEELGTGPSVCVVAAP